MNDINPISEFNPSNPDQAREIAASLVRNHQITVEDANKHLEAHKAPPLQVNSIELAKGEKARLMGDSDFTAKYLRGDPDAVKRLTDLDIRISRGGPERLTDRDAAPADQYHFDTAARYQGQLQDKEIMKLDGDFTTWATDLKLDPALASAVVSLAYDTDRVTDKEAFASDQQALFDRVMGGPEAAKAKMAAAQKILDATSGNQKVNLESLVKTGGAEVVVHLINHATALAAKTGKH